MAWLFSRVESTIPAMAEMEEDETPDFGGLGMMGRTVPTPTAIVKRAMAIIKPLPMSYSISS